MPARKLPPNDRVIEMYQSRMSSGEIAEKCKVSPITVISLLRRLGVVRRSNQEAANIRAMNGRQKITRYWLGKKQPPEMIEARAAKVRGPNNPRWKGGHSKREYRKVVTKEICAECGTTENLGIHHINDDHYDNTPENLQVLCVSCHMSLHKTAYWKAKREGRETPKSNGPVGWEKKGGVI